MADNNGVDEQSQDEFEDDQQGQQQDEMSNAEPNDDNEPEANGETDDEVIITIGEDPPPQEEVEKEAAPQWVKDLRKRERELARENRELKAAQAAKAEPVPQLGAEPTLEDCEFDTDKYKQKLLDWHEQKRSVEQKAAQERQAAEQAQKAWQEKVSSYQTARTTLKVANFEDAEATALDALNVTQQGIILEGCTPEQAAKLMYALGTNSAELKRLASITNPVQFAFAAADLRNQMKVTQKKSAPPAERRIVGSAAAVAVNDPKLARLEAEADKTGDRSALIAYKKAIKSKAA